MGLDDFDHDWGLYQLRDKKESRNLAVLFLLSYLISGHIHLSGVLKLRRSSLTAYSTNERLETNLAMGFIIVVPRDIYHCMITTFLLNDYLLINYYREKLQPRTRFFQFQAVLECMKTVYLLIGNVNC